VTWYYVTAIVVAILVGATGIITTLLKAVWSLSELMGSLRTSIVELRMTLATHSFKLDETQKDVNVLNSKVESVQTMQSSLQARTIRLEEKVDIIRKDTGN
jgi:hypothetical protein